VSSPKGWFIFLRYIFLAGVFFSLFAVDYFFSTNFAFYVFSVFGYFTFFLPVIFLDLQWSINVFVVFLISDNLLNDSAIPLDGVLGQFISSDYRILVTFFLVCLLFFCSSLFKEYENISSCLDDNNKISEEKNISRDIENILNNCQIPCEVKSYLSGKKITTYFLKVNKKIKTSRFLSLSTITSKKLKKKVRHLAFDGEYAIEVPKENKLETNLLDISKSMQPGKITFQTSIGQMILVKLDNILFLGKEDYWKNILFLLLISQMKMEIILFRPYNEEDLNCAKDFFYLEKDSSIFDSLIFELNKRWLDFLSKPKRENNFHPIIIVTNWCFEKDQQIKFLIRYGLKFSMYIFLLDNSSNYTNLFKIIISSKVNNKMESMRKIGVSGAEYLIDANDCLLVNRFFEKRISLPVTNISEMKRVIKFFQKNNIKIKPDIC